jgi:uncharacterized protein YggE
MKIGWRAVRLIAGLVVLSPLLSVSQVALAQQSETPEVIAARKAALVIDGQGTVQCKPTGYSFHIEFFVEKAGGRKVVLADYQQYREAVKDALAKAGFSNVSIPNDNPELAMRLQENSYHTSGIAAEVWDRPAAVIRAKGLMFVSVNGKAQAERVFETLRATGGTGFVKVFYQVDDLARYRLIALKSAVEDVKQRVKTLSEAAKPKEFELLFLKEGEFQKNDHWSYAAIEGKEPLRLSESIEATANLTMYYTLRPAATVAKATPAGNSLPKTNVPSRTPKAVSKPTTPTKGKN